MYTSYAGNFEVYHNGMHIFTFEKTVFWGGKTQVHYINELTKANSTRIYKSEKSADIQITKTTNKLLKMYKNYIFETESAADTGETEAPLF